MNNLPPMPTGRTHEIVVECMDGSSKECCRTMRFMVAPDDFIAWTEGTMIQDAMPYLTAGEREMLISGTCPACWRDLFGG